MPYQSRFGIRPEDLATGVHAAQELQYERRPTCNPCQEGDHSRCPTGLAERGVIDSDFDCPCYQRDPDEHAPEWERDADQEDWSRYGN